MTTTLCAAPPHRRNEAGAAISNAQGTVLPRSGVFWGVHPPNCHSAVVVGDLAHPQERETQVRFWYEPHGHQLEQTSPTSSQVGRLRLKNFEIILNEAFAGSRTDLTSSRLSTDLYSRTAPYSIIRNVDAPCVFAPNWSNSTDSPWQDFRSVIALLLDAPGAILEALRATMERKDREFEKSRHIGLASVAWLTEALGLSRPTILRMGGVAESTFYSWQKNPQSSARTPSISRILRLQAQLSLLDRVLGRNGLRTWVLTGDRLERLQEEDDEKFAQIIAEAEETVLSATQVAPRPRMRLADYNLDEEQISDIPGSESSVWPGASKLPDEQAE